jgi:hypothetical protein
MDDERLNKTLLHLGNAVMAQHQGLQELMAHLAKTGEAELAAKLLASQEQSILALQRFVAEIESKAPDAGERVQ